VGELPVNFTGKSRIATAVNGQVPAPLLRWRQGDTVTIRVTNRLSVPTSIHWHGLIVPADMDGVPGLSFSGIGAGETFTYRFKVNQSGTYWYHSHSRFQEQIGLYGPIVVERRDQKLKADREHVILLSDWTDIDPEHIYRTLKQKSDYFNYSQRTASDFFRDMREQGFSRAVTDRSMWGQMRMNPTDLLDVSGYAYTYLLNGVTPDNNWTGIFKRGEKVRLRFINGSSMSIFDVRIPGLKLTVISADGQEVDPVTVDEFRIAAAETYDVIVEPQDDSAYTIFAQALDRSGFARGTLAPQIGMQAIVPSVDPRPLLTMADMAMAHDMAHEMDGMDHSKMDHGSAGTKQSPQHARDEYGPTVDSLAEQPQSRLDDPGVGLRGNGRRVLTYADLHTIGGPIDHRMPGRQIELHLTGHMQRFIWSFNGQKFSQAEPLRFNHGERLRIVLVNDSMMTHPIHLHGMWSELETEQGEFLVRKHSVMVQPGQRISYAVTADAIGRWAYHCHLLYHMEAGMFREVVVAHAKEGA
jgi:CopA family copper-resistance protein